MNSLDTLVYSSSEQQSVPTYVKYQPSLCADVQIIYCLCMECTLEANRAAEGMKGSALCKIHSLSIIL